MNELDLVKQCQQANPKAQEQLYGLYSDRLYRLACRYVKSQPDAEDVLIKAFTKILRGLANFHPQGEGSLAGWMRKVVVNEALMWLRQRHNFNLMESLDASLTEVDFNAFAELEAADVYAFIARLPTGYRTVFNLFVVEGYDHDEIGRMLHIAVGTSRSQLFKAKAMLKKMMSQEGFHYGT